MQLVWNITRRRGLGLGHCSSSSGSGGGSRERVIIHRGIITSFATSRSKLLTHYHCVRALFNVAYVRPQTMMMVLNRGWLWKLPPRQPSPAIIDTRYGTVENVVPDGSRVRP